MSDFLIYLLVILLSILAVGMAAILVSYWRDIRAARKRLAGLGSQMIETRCGPIEYARIGEGYPVLVVHGAMGGFDQGLWIARSFNAPHCQFICPSRFGYLRTPIPPGADLDLQADAFACLLDALGIQQAAVFGVSAGSTSAIRFAARYAGRVSALILIGPDAPGEIQMQMPPRFIFDRLLRSDFAYWILITFFSKVVQNAVGLVPKEYDLTPEHAAAVKMIQKGDLPVSKRIDGLVYESYNLADEFMASVTAASPYPLGKIETPVLVVNAKDDPISLPVNVRAMTEQMPQARLFAVEDGGHFFFGHMDEVRKEIRQFLSSHVAELPYKEESDVRQAA